MNDIELLTSVLNKTQTILGFVESSQLDGPTPCPEFNVSQLMNHIVGWVQVFAAGCNKIAFTGDAEAYQCGLNPAQEFEAAADAIVTGWSAHGLDRLVPIMSGSEMPGVMVFNMTLMEYMAHGWDLAIATGQSVPFTDDEAIDVLARALVTLPPEYQGAGMPFGATVPTPADASSISEFVAFLGRQPEWSAR